MKRTATQAGFSLITAIFVVVVLAALGVAMVTMSSGQHLTLAGAHQASRAYYAARSGIEYGVERVLTTGGCAGVSANPSFAAFADMAVTTTCAAQLATTEAGVSYTIYQLTVTAKTSGATPGQPSYASRTLSVSFSNP